MHDERAANAAASRAAALCGDDELDSSSGSLCAVMQGSSEDSQSGSSYACSSVMRRLGFRTVELVTDALPAAALPLLQQDQTAGRKLPEEAGAEEQSQGSVFYFRVNGVAVFAKGANLIPLNILPTNVTGAAIRRLLDDAAAANMNMVRWRSVRVVRHQCTDNAALFVGTPSSPVSTPTPTPTPSNNQVRIWGGGVYPKDALYHHADQLGLMIWQETGACVALPSH